MRTTTKLLAIAALALGALTSPCQALDILLTNDDGFEASTTHALYQLLKARGHRVIISAPSHNGTGMGGALPAGPIGPLLTPTRSAHVKAGAPGVGTLPSDPDVYYVNSSPAVSVLHGIDVAAKRKWNKAPDLVISGPNYGNNVGILTIHSGTFNAAMTALNRGVPAIAVSAAALLDWYRPFDALRPLDKEHEVAEVVSRLVDELGRTRADPSRPLFPLGVGLNMNLPEFIRGTGSALPFKFSKVGTAVGLTPMFVENLAADPIGALALMPALPGVSVHVAGLSPGSITRINDADPSSEQNIINGGAVALSVIQTSHQAGPEITGAIATQLSALVSKPAR